MLQPFNITLHVYAENEQEAKELENALRDFIVRKYAQGVYPRASRLTQLVSQYGDSMLIFHSAKYGQTWPNVAKRGQIWSNMVKYGQSRVNWDYMALNK